MMDIYFLFTEDFKTCNLKDYEKYLSGEEMESRAKFVFQKDRDQYLLTRALARKILSQELGVQFSSLEFKKNQYGKPYLSEFHKEVVFNISHSSGLIVLAVLKNGETIGIDVEKIDRKINIDIRSTVFSPQEIQDQSMLPEALQQQRFFELWTLKESYMKAIGKGFSLSPKSFSFIFGSEGCKFLENPFESAPEQFAFHLYEINPFYNLAICHQREMKKINSFRILPYWEITNFNMDPKLLI